jgi:phosphoglycolate phosphatase-like HAD superfamily hydrolase
MKIILLIFQIGQILIKIAPELYEAFMAILAAVKQTPEAGNVTAEMAVKSAARAIIPALDVDTAAKLAATLESYEKGRIEYEETFSKAA